MPIVIKEIIVKTTVESAPQWSEQLEEIVNEVKQQVLTDLELKYGIETNLSSEWKAINDR